MWKSLIEFVLTDLKTKGCCERVIAHDVIEIWRTQMLGELIFTGAQLCNGIYIVYGLTKSTADHLPMQIRNLAPCLYFAS